MKENQVIQNKNSTTQETIFQHLTKLLDVLTSQNSNLSIDAEQDLSRDISNAYYQIIENDYFDEFLKYCINQSSITLTNLTLYHFKHLSQQQIYSLPNYFPRQKISVISIDNVSKELSTDPIILQEKFNTRVGEIFVINGQIFIVAGIDLSNNTLYFLVEPYTDWKGSVVAACLGYPIDCRTLSSFDQLTLDDLAEVNLSDYTGQKKISKIIRIFCYVLSKSLNEEQKPTYFSNKSDVLFSLFDYFNANPNIGNYLDLDKITKQPWQHAEKIKYLRNVNVDFYLPFLPFLKDVRITFQKINSTLENEKPTIEQFLESSFRELINQPRQFIKKIKSIYEILGIFSSLGVREFIIGNIESIIKAIFKRLEQESSSLFLEALELLITSSNIDLDRKFILFLSILDDVKMIPQDGRLLLFTQIYKLLINNERHDKLIKMLLNFLKCKKLEKEFINFIENTSHDHVMRCIQRICLFDQGYSSFISKLEFLPLYNKLKLIPSTPEHQLKPINITSFLSRRLRTLLELYNLNIGIVKPENFFRAENFYVFDDENTHEEEILRLVKTLILQQNLPGDGPYNPITSDYIALGLYNSSLSDLYGLAFIKNLKRCNDEENSFCCKLVSFAIDSELRGEKLGSLFLSACIEILHNNGIDSISLLSLQRAIRFYQKFGFTLTDENVFDSEDEDAPSSQYMALSINNITQVYEVALMCYQSKFNNLLGLLDINNYQKFLGDLSQIYRSIGENSFKDFLATHIAKNFFEPIFELFMKKIPPEIIIEGEMKKAWNIYQKLTHEFLIKNPHFNFHRAIYWIRYNQTENFISYLTTWFKEVGKDNFRDQLSKALQTKIIPPNSEIFFLQLESLKLNNGSQAVFHVFQEILKTNCPMSKNDFDCIKMENSVRFFKKLKIESNDEFFNDNPLLEPMMK